MFSIRCSVILILLLKSDDLCCCLRETLMIDSLVTFCQQNVALQVMSLPRYAGYRYVQKSYPEIHFIRWFDDFNIREQLILSKVYDGAAADVWSSGVILFELLAGHLPFDESSLMSLYKKISRAEYTFPRWFTESQKKLISRILDPNPRTV